MKKNNRLPRGSTAVVCAALALLAVSSVRGQAVLLEGFETISLTQDGNAKGDASIKNIYFTINPTELNKQLLLTTIGGADVGAGYITESGTAAVPVGTMSGLASFLGIASTTINNGPGVNGSEGSGFKEMFSLNAGDLLTFNYDFLTQEPSDGSSGK